MKPLLVVSLLALTSYCGAVDFPIRVNCGGPASGAWLSDAEFVSGGKAHRFAPGHFTTGVENPAPKTIYETVRHQNHRYEFDVPLGKYRVRIHFTDPFPDKGRAMDYRVNGVTLIDNYNPYQSLRKVKQVQVLEAVVAAKRGKLVIEADKDKGNDVFQAGIEIERVSLFKKLTKGRINRKMMELSKPSGMPLSTALASDSIRQLTGAHTRLVWLQRDGFAHYTKATSKTLLFGYDSDDQFGVRAILSERDAYSKPIFTTGGTRVVYTNRKENRVYMVNFDGSEKIDLGPGFASEVWRDPASGIEWVYLREKGGEVGDSLVRRRLDQPEIEQSVYSRTDSGIEGVPWFQLSADGSRFSDAFPWPKCGIGELPGGAWKLLLNGCWPSIAPDNSYRVFVFDGNHTHATVFEPGGKSTQLILSNVPGLERKKVYFPRWTNQSRFITVVSPERDDLCDLYLGRFNQDWTEIEAWARVTNNEMADMFGDAWIKPGGPYTDRIAAATPQAAKPVAAQQPAPAALGDSWPGTRDGLIWLWENSAAQNQAPALPGETREFPGDGLLRGRAWFGSGHNLMLERGWFAAGAEAGPRITASCKQTNQLTIEAVVTSFAAEQSGPARIISLSQSQTSRNFTLGQDGRNLALRLRTSETDLNGVNNSQQLAELQTGRPVHVVVTYQSGSMNCYFDGRKVFETAAVRGDFSNWQDMPLILGDEVGGGRDWAGSLEGLAIYNRALSPETVRAHAGLISSRLQRNAVTPAVVEAKLIEAARSPEVADLAAYRRALVENVYQVTKVLSGPKPKTEKIVVRQWVILDREKLPPLPAPGGTARLRLEPNEAHPQLSSEYRSSDHAEYGLPLFLDAGSHLR